MTNSKVLVGDVTLNKSSEYMTHVQVTDTHLNDGSDGALLGMNTECLVGQVINSAVGDESLLIFTDHWLRALQSRPLSRQVVSNASAALTIMQTLSDRVVLVSGHVHQESDAVVQGVRMLTTPSTCTQFAPVPHDFALDDKQPGYRRIVLQPIAHIETQVISICDEENRPLSGSSGYH